MLNLIIIYFLITFVQITYLFTGSAMKAEHMKMVPYRMLAIFLTQKPPTQIHSFGNCRSIMSFYLCPKRMFLLTADYLGRYFVNANNYF